MPIAYCVDAENRIISIEGPWDDFARENGAPRLTRDAVLGRRLLHYVSGYATRELVSGLLARAREGAPVSVPFRCDSPSKRRFLRLDLRSLSDGGVRLDSVLEREVERDPQSILDTGAARGVGLVVVCSWCRKVRVESRWVEVEEAIEALGLFGRARQPHLSHGICEACEAIARTPPSGPPR